MKIGKELMRDLRKTALEAVEQANQILMRYWPGGLDGGKSTLVYEAKEDSSPVTMADYEAERQIRAVIERRFPDHQIKGEEFGGKAGTSSPFLWLIDPIDGTKNFTRGQSFFGTQVALMHEGSVILGVSGAPALSHTIVAALDEGSFLRGRRISVSKTEKLKDAFVTHGSIRYFSRIGKLDSLARICAYSWGDRGYGDFWSYHLLALGSVDVVLEAGTKPWDVAAVSLIVEEAGGRVTDLWGRPISLGSTTVVATNRILHEEVLQGLGTA